MQFTSTARPLARFSPALLALLAVPLWFLVVAHAQDKARVKLVINITDAAGKSVDGAQVVIRRAGTNSDNVNLNRIDEPAKGEQIVRPGTDFNLTDDFNASHTLRVTAKDYQPAEVEIRAAELREAAHSRDQTLTKEVRLERPAAGGGATQPVGGAAAQPGIAGAQVDGSPRGLDQGGEPGMLMRVRRRMNDLIWWLGMLMLLLTGLTVVGWKFGFRPSLRRPDSRVPPPAADADPDRGVGAGDGGQMRVAESIAGSIVGITDALKTVREDQGKIVGQLEALSNKVDKIKEMKLSASTSLEREPAATQWPALAPVQQPEPPAPSARHVEFAGAATAGSPAPRPGDRGESRPYTAPPQYGARAAYQSLLQRGSAPIEPVYLNAEGKNSLADALGDGPVYLSEVGHSQGTFVLFSDGEQSGWIFPNPVLAFREHSLRPIFPALTEDDFNRAKDRIEPRLASKVSERRWILGQS